MSRPTRDDLIAGAVFIAFGVAFAATAATYETGSLLRMGPGYFPMVLGIILAALGVAIILTRALLARRTTGATAPAGTTRDGGENGGEHGGQDGDGVPWVRGLLVLVAIMFFGFAIAPLGLVPALLVATFLSALAGHGTRPVSALVIAVALTALCVVIFVVILQLELPLVAGR